MSEVMDLHSSVFNGHINSADKRARALMRVIAPDWLERVEKIEKDGNGIMAIFDRQVSVEVIMYCALVAAYVNENRAVDLPEVGCELTTDQLAAVISSKLDPEDPNYAYKIKANAHFAAQIHAITKRGGVWGWPATATIWEITEAGFRRTA